MPAPALAVHVCSGLACQVAHRGELAAQVTELLGPGIEVAPLACPGRCDRAPVVRVADEWLGRAAPEHVLNLLMLGASGDAMPEAGADFLSYEDYRADGGYALAAALAARELDPAQALDALQASALRDPVPGTSTAADAWRALQSRPGATLEVAVRACFTDQALLRRDPHRFVDGLLIAALLANAGRVRICIAAGEECQALLHEQLRAVEENPPCALPAWEVVEAGASAQAHALGTFWWVREILEKGPDWFHGFGRRGRHGLRAVGVAGRVAEPGLKVVPAGTTVAELVDECCGGMQEGHAFSCAVAGDAFIVLGDRDDARASPGAVEGGHVIE